jgi:flagellar motor switch protein FliN/FliY
MAELSTLTAAQVASACRAGAAEATAAFRRALAVEADIAIGEPSTLAPDRWPEGFAGAGLVLVFRSGPQAAAVILPESTGLLPDWCASPDATGQSKLSTLAQELGMLLLPEDFMPEDFKAGYAADLGDALAKAGVTGEVASVPLEFVGKRPRAFLLWPIPSPDQLLAQTPSGTSPPKPTTAASSAAPQPAVSSPLRSTAPHSLPTHSRRRCSLADLPSYTRSLLRVRVPVVVTLAAERQPIHRIIDIAPGAIIQFDKSCEEMLELAVADRVIAEGEAVKIGDKFGLRITSIVLPEERFYPLRPVQRT